LAAYNRPHLEWCVSYAVGFPFRVACGLHDPPVVRVFDGCGALSSGREDFHALSGFAAADDYFVGLFGVLAIAGCVALARSRDGTRTSG
jgi:hypothetical protein